MTPTRIVIIAKAPLPGFAKTRLIPALGAAGAAALARLMLQRTLSAASQAGLGPIELCCAPVWSAPAWDGVAVPEGCVLTEQGEGDLGARMARASLRAIAQGESVLLIGTDCPTVDADLLKEAAAALEQADASLVPTYDGGYALLGLRRFDGALFEAMPWSTAEVAPQTRQRLARMGWRLAELPTQHDIDEPADLQWLPAEWRTALMAMHAAN